MSASLFRAKAAYPAAATPAVTTFSTGPTAWKAIYGGIQSGFTPNVFYTGDGLTLVHRNTKIGPDYIVDGYWSTILPAGQRNLSALSFSYNHRVSKVGPSHLVYAYNFVTGQWESLSTATTAPTAATARQVTVTGDPNRFVSATGEVRLRLHYWTNAVSFTTTIDQVNFATSFQP
jgi:hypothetical protein